MKAIKIDDCLKLLCYLIIEFDNFTHIFLYLVYNNIMAMNTYDLMII